MLFAPAERLKKNTEGMYLTCIFKNLGENAIAFPDNSLLLGLATSQREVQGEPSELDLI